MTAPLSVKGYSNASATWWPDTEEQTPELVWPKSVEVYDRMRRQDAQVMSVLRAVTLPIRRTPWRLDPTGCRPEVVQLCSEDLGLPVLGQPYKAPTRTRDRFSWVDHLRLALLMLPHGHSVFEQEARYDSAGRARLHKLAWRPPKTISAFNVADDGGLESIEQWGIGKTVAKMPVDRLAVYVHEREGGNWVGTSLLRPAYKFWLLKDRALRTQAQTLERNGLGVPVYTAGEHVNDELDGAELQRREDAEVAKGLQMAAAVRAGDNSGASLRHGATLELKGVSGSLPPADPVIRYYDEQIARVVLAHFLNLGTETGSWALGSTFADFFVMSLQTVAQEIADVTSQHVVEDMVDWNWGEEEPAPRIVFDEIGSRHASTADAIQKLIACKAITPDEPLEQFLRTAYGLPDADPDTARETAAPAAPEQPATPPPPPAEEPVERRQFS